MPRRFHRGEWALLMVSIIGLSAIGYLVLVPVPPSSRLASAGVPPSFTLPRAGGSSFTLGEHLGKTNILILFSEGLSCDQCMREVLDLEASYSRFNALRTMVVVVTTDSLSDLSRWAERHGVTKVILLSDESGKVMDAYGMRAPDVSRVPFKKAGNSFVVVHVSATIRLRVDYGPDAMYVPVNQILDNLSAALF